jgi:hypothetical protein
MGDAERVKPMDPFEQLAGEKVPPVPTARTFTDGVRRKLHPRLLVLHVIEFAFGATWWAVMHMTTALAAAARYTLTGTWPPRDQTLEKQAGSGPENER